MRLAFHAPERNTSLSLGLAADGKLSPPWMQALTKSGS
jgi:hypothetical protein